MKRWLTIIILSIMAVNLLIAQKTSQDFKYLATFPIKDKKILIDDMQNYMKTFFDKWNNFYLPNADSHVVSVYNSSFQPKSAYVSGNEEEIFQSQFACLSYGESVVYASDKLATLFYFQDGKLVDVINRIGIGGEIIAGDLGMLYDRTLKRPRGWLLTDRATRTIKELDPKQLIDFVRVNGNDYGLSLRGDAILYNGITWDQYGSSLVWNDNKHCEWIFIDKDGIAFGKDGIDRNGKVVGTFDFSQPLTTRNPGNGGDDLTMDYEGNFYYLAENDIYYLGRDWGYDKTFKGIVNDSGVSLRLHAGVQELKLGVLDNKEEVTVLEKTLQKESIGGQAAAWYKVKRQDGFVGWMYGAFLTLPEGDEGILIYDSPAMRLRGD